MALSSRPMASLSFFCLPSALFLSSSKDRRRFHRDTADITARPIRTYTPTHR